MNVVVSIGGSVLAPAPGSDRVAAHAAVVDTLLADGYRVGAVVGGGGVAREYIDAARELGANEIELDQLGIDVTRLNARLLIAALETETVVTPAHEYETARESLSQCGLAVMGGVAPAQTTDAVAAALAEYVDADLLVYATSVPGVYDDDPNENDAASRFEQLTPSELVDVIVDVEMTAGAAAPVDLLAAKVIERAGLRTIVLDGSSPDQIAHAIRTGEHEGTDVIPPGNDAEIWTDDD